MKKKVIILIVMIVVIGGCSFNKSKELNDSEKFKNEYESLNATIREKDGKTIRTIEIDVDNPMIYKSATDIVERIKNKETFVVYFGFNDCPWCRSVLPTFIDVCNKLNINEVYYVDVKDLRDTLIVDDDGNIVREKEGEEGYNELLNLMDSILEEYTLTDKDGNKVDTKEKRIYAPNFVTVVDGNPTSLTSGISDLQTNGYQELTDDIVDDMESKLTELLTTLASENICDDSGC